jgi:hypothetical protein
MASRTGSAVLPLHGGRVPAWLGQRMSTLGAIVTEAIVHHYGTDAFLERLAHPFWFQSFGAVMGMDWHSSGITTSVIGALKCGLASRQDELGIYVCGGRGKHSRKTPDELHRLGDRIGIDGEGLTRSSRLVAKVDSAAVQDGFDLYLHGFFVPTNAKWTVVQQGMNGDKKQARRYHWHSAIVQDFVDEPHSAIDGPAQGEIINLTDRRASHSRSAQLALLGDLGPDRLVAELQALDKTSAAQPELPHLIMPVHHDVRSKDVFARRLHGTLAAVAEKAPDDYPNLLLTTSDFVDEAATSDMFEIQSSKLAAERTKGDVQAFARQMVSDHTKTTSELKELAPNAEVQLPGEMTSSQQRMIDKLKGLEGDDFVKQYMDDQLSGHKDAVSLFERYGKGGENDALKNWASQTLPTLQNHLDMAQDIHKKL